MPGITLNDELGIEPVEEQTTEQQKPETEQNGGMNVGSLLSILKKQTGEGSIDDYVHHPLNQSESKAMAQIIRGATGLFGDIRLVIVDLLFGYINLKKEGVKHTHNPSESQGFPTHFRG